MYGNNVAGATVSGAGGTLAFTGTVFNVLWLAAAGFALFAVGVALVRLAPKADK